jgi:hypothetical protein
MKVGEGSLGSRCSSCSFAFFDASFLRHRSTDAAAASSVNRSMMVVAVKSGHQLVHIIAERLAYPEQLPHHDLGFLMR